MAVVPVPCGQEGYGEANWMYSAMRDDGHVRWFAVASPNTPAPLIRALCAVLADPAPVPRAHLPGPRVGRLA